MPRFFHGPTRPRRSAAVIAAFISVGVLAAIGVAGIAIGLAVGVLPILVALPTAAALALWVFGMARFVDLAQRPYPVSLDCRDGQHDACPLCGCICHKDHR